MAINKRKGGDHHQEGNLSFLTSVKDLFRLQQLLPALVIGCLIGYNLQSITGGSSKLKDTAAAQHQHTSLRTTAVVSSGSINLESERQLAESGWRTVRVFAGDTNMHLQERLKARGDPNQTWFAQVGQDRIISKLLRNKTQGYFIDLASNDAISISNTLGLELNLNWTGLCMEANPFCWYSLAYYRKCQVVAAVVGGPNRTKVNFVYQRGLGGIHDKNHDTNSPDLLSKSKMQLTVSLLEIFKLYHVPHVIDYLSLDVEGAEGLILEHFPFDTYKFSILTIERPKEALKALLQQHGYIMLNDKFSNFGETAWAHQSVLDTLDKSAFDITYPNNWMEEAPKIDPMCA